MSAVTHKVSLLASVPEVHLQSGAEICRNEGFVAFGSMAWELFRKLDVLRDGLPVEVLIYPSHAGESVDYTVRWRGKYIGHVHSEGGAHPDGMRHRPPTTTSNPEDNLGHWAVFWHVSDLQPLSDEEAIPIGRLRGYGKKQPYGRGFVPRGPVIVEAP